MSSEVRKAAIILMTLPQEDAAAIIAKLPTKAVEAVTVAIARMGIVTGEEQVEALNEFATCNPAAFGSEAGGLDKAKELVERALGKGASGTLDNVRAQIEAVPFGFLQKVDSQNLLTFITDEHPQTIALILSHMTPQQAAEIIAGLPGDRQLAVVRRIANMGQTNPEIIKEVESGLERRMASVMSQQFEAAGGVEAVAEILNVADRTTERNLLESLAQEDGELVEDIRRLMFVFEDLTRLSDKGIQEVLKNVETSQWAMALKGASEQLKRMVLGNLSSRAATLLEEEMDFLGAVRVSDVEQVQQQIVDIVRRLEDAGQINLHTDPSGEQMVQ